MQFVILKGKRKFGSARKIECTNDTSSYVQKPYLRINYSESKKEEFIDEKNHSKTKNLPNPIDSHEPPTKLYLDILFKDPSRTKNSAQVDFKDRTLDDNVHFDKVTVQPLYQST